MFRNLDLVLVGAAVGGLAAYLFLQSRAARAQVGSIIDNVSTDGGPKLLSANAPADAHANVDYGGRLAGYGSNGTWFSQN